jgi:hypothetical protein
MTRNLKNQMHFWRTRYKFISFLTKFYHKMNLSRRADTSNTLFISQYYIICFDFTESNEEW